MFDAFKMMGKVKEFQERMKQAQEQLRDLRLTGEAGGGRVKAVVDGRKNLLSLQIDPELSDNQIIQGLVVMAINSAGEQAERAAKDLIRQKTEGLLPPIPGLDIGSLLG